MLDNGLKKLGCPWGCRNCYRIMRPPLDGGWRETPNLQTENRTRTEFKVQGSKFKVQGLVSKRSLTYWIFRLKRVHFVLFKVQGSRFKVFGAAIAAGLETFDESRDCFA